MRWSFDASLWAIATVLLLAAEAMAPGAFMLWLAFAAAAVFLIVLLLPDLPFVVQALAFVALAVLSIRVLRRRFQHQPRGTDQPALNRRAEQLVGRVVPLVQPIVGGQGRVQIADAFWDVEGPDLPAGARVRVVGAQGMTLLVEPQA